MYCMSIETPTSRTEWLDVTAAEIREDIENGDTALALDKAKKRYESLWRLRVRDIDRIDPEELENTTMKDWENEQESVKLELIDLAEILLKLNHNKEEIKDQLHQLKND